MTSYWSTDLCQSVFSSHPQDSNTTRYHVVLAERLLKTDLQPGGYRETLLGFPFQIGIYPRNGKVCSQTNVSVQVLFFSISGLEMPESL